MERYEPLPWRDMGRNSIIVILCLFALLAGCSPVGRVAEPPSAPSPAAAFAPTSASVPTATQTIEASIVSTSTFSVDQQATQQARTNMEPTLESLAATEAVILPDCGWGFARDYSADGNWIAVECIEYGLGVYNLNNLSRSWYFSYYETYGKKDDHGTPFGRLRPEYWSSDGKYLYFAAFSAGDGGCVWYAGGQALIRLDLFTGELKDILLPGEEVRHYDFSFSADDAYLAYFEAPRESPSLILRHLINGAQEEITIGGAFSGAGSPVWSPSNDSILFSARSGEQCEDMAYSLILVDLNTYGQQIILDGQTTPYLPISWTEENGVILEEAISDERYSLDLATGKLAPFVSSASTLRP